uniref:DIRP domain-containing protein n=1 Tax=Anopheles atroparvus TaxID=41427 RepID=A0AAG5CP01_ANOAO
MDSEGSPPPTFWPAALGLHPVGTKFPIKTTSTQPVQVLNARGRPARIRKKNRLFFDDDIINDKIPSARATPKKTPGSAKKPTSCTKSAPQAIPRSELSMTPQKLIPRSVFKKKYSSRYANLTQSVRKRKIEHDERNHNSLKGALMDKKWNQSLGLQFRNFLILPKAHRFCYYEFFYCDIDRHIFGSPNEFQQLLQKHYPLLETKNLTRTEWRKIRTSFGKPRIFSSAFVAQERMELARKREKIRVLQANSMGDISFMEGMPSSIPKLIPNGTKVTARLRTPYDGVFNGTVENYVPDARSYIIAFDRLGVGSRLIPDIEVFSTEQKLATIKVNSITKDYRVAYRNASFYLASPTVKSPKKLRDPLLGGESAQKQNMNKKAGITNENIGGYPVKYLELIVRTKKTLSAKQMKLLRLQNITSEAQIYKSYDNPLPEEFKKRYAMLIVAIDKLNRDLADQVKQLREYVGTLTEDPEMLAMITPSHLREHSREKAAQIFEKNNNGNVKNEHISNLIKHLTTIMYLASNVNKNGKDELSILALKGTIVETRELLEPANVAAFNRNVASQMNYIDCVPGTSKTVKHECP